MPETAGTGYPPANGKHDNITPYPPGSTSTQTGYPPTSIEFSIPPVSAGEFVEPTFPQIDPHVVIHPPQTHVTLRKSFWPDTSDWPWWKWVLVVIVLILFGPVVLAAGVVCFFLWVSAKYGESEDGGE